MKASRRPGKGRYIRTNLAAGHPVKLKFDGGEKRQIVIRFDADLFGEIAKFSRQESTTFNDAVATLCEWGLEEINK
jgi:predicted DNA-binding antitoxin AbrB/MazE fold protein